MNQDNDGWVAFKDREPDLGDYPLAIFVRGTGQMIVYQSEYARDRDPLHGCATHWVKLNLPPKPKESTQAEVDDAAYCAWLDENSSRADAWHAALAWERAQVAEMLRERMPANADERIPIHFLESLWELLAKRTGVRV